MARTESPSQGYRLAAASLPCPGRSFGTYGRGDRRRTNGTAVVEGFPREQKSPHLHIPIGSTTPICAETPCGTGTIPHTERSFFLYEKSVLRESDFLRGRKPEVCTDLTLPFSALKKALKKLRVPRGFNPLGGRLAGAKPRALTLGQSPRGLALEGLPFVHAQIPKSAASGADFDFPGWTGRGKDDILVTGGYHHKE